VTAVDMTTLVIWEGNIYRMMFGPVVEQGIWRIRNNKLWGELYKDLDIEADIKEKRLEYGLDMW
jgi:hypothetical protein